MSAIATAGRRASAAFRGAKTQLFELPHYLRFARFYERLADKRSLFYLFVSTGLLHWARKALQFIPETVNLAVIGSSLTPGELLWLRENVARPIHHIELAVDDKTVWDFLFRANCHDFGWVDSDCFVLNPALFDELAALGSGVAVRCAWTHRIASDLLAHGARPVQLARTHLMFVGAAPLRHVRRRTGVSACTYNYQGSREGRTFERALYAASRLPTRRQVELLRTVLRPDGPGRTVYPLPGFEFFDTTFVFQLLALALGYRVEPVRSLVAECSGELVHVGGVSYYRRWRSRGGAWASSYRRVLGLNLLVLDEAAPHLPGEYAVLRERLAGELEAMGVRRGDLRAEVSAAAIAANVPPSALQDPRLAFLRES